MPFRISVIGTGYLGATHAACLAELGFEVLGLDVDAAKVAMLTAGSVPFHEPGLDELVARHVATGRLRFTTSWNEAATFGDVVYLCVGTPQRPDGLGADLGYLEGAVDALAPHLRGRRLVVGKSTVPVGTSAQLSARLLPRVAPDCEVELAWNPEFLREGTAVADTLRPDRIVVGVGSELAEKVLREIHSAQIDDGVPFLVTDIPTAELLKVAANAFLATKVSFMNIMADLCDATGADVLALREALSHDPRIGRKYLHAGLGFGGGCLPKDIRSLMSQALELGVDRAVGFLSEIDAINVARRDRIVRFANVACEGSVEDKRVAVLGASFKPDSDDVRDSPALNVAAQLREQGAVVSVYDPVAAANAARAVPHLRYATSAVEAADGAHLLMHLTEWAEFQELEPAAFDGVVTRKYILDGRNALDAGRWRREGWVYRGMGRP
jgi:UDPglucose 6-dehydrogenase